MAQVTWRLHNLLLQVHIFLVLWGTTISTKACPSDAHASYTAAVVEYSPALGVTSENGWQRFRENIATFAEYAAEARRQGAEIVVFPECGLVTLELPRQSDGSPLVSLEIPPIGSNPCAAEAAEYTQELRDLSCAARTASIYVVVNLPEKQRCAADPAVADCGGNGLRFFNTDVAFDRQGAVVARYRKFNLYGEAGFVPPAQPSLDFFDSDFGVRFGLFTCFDLMFERPAVTLVTDAGVTDVIFPTAWFSELPFLTAAQAQASWAMALNVNFLGAGYNLPLVGSTGSGLYAGRRGVVVAAMLGRRASQLLVGQLPIRNSCAPAAEGALPAPPPAPMALAGRVVELAAPARAPPAPSEAQGSPSESGEPAPSDYASPLRKLLPNGEFSVSDDASYIYLKTEDLDKYETSLLLDNQNQDIQLCYGEFCCHFVVYLDSEEDGDTEQRDRYYYRVVAFEGLRSFDGIIDGGLQVCGIIACTGTELGSCGKLHGDSAAVSRSTFRQVRVRGSFRRQHALALPSTLGGDLLPLPGEAFTLTEIPKEENESEILLESNEPLHLITFGIYSRDFARDPAKKSTTD